VSDVAIEHFPLRQLPRHVQLAPEIHNRLAPRPPGEREHGDHRDRDERKAEDVGGGFAQVRCHARLKGSRAWIPAYDDNAPLGAAGAGSGVPYVRHSPTVHSATHAVIEPAVMYGEVW